MKNQQSSNIIKQRCKERNISITQLLSGCGLTKSFIYDLEQRKTCPSADKFERIADYLDCSVDYLLGRTDVPEVNHETKYETLPIAARDGGILSHSLTKEEIQQAEENTPELPPRKQPPKFDL